MKDRVERLKSEIGAAEQKKIDILFAATEELMALYGQDRSAANLKNWQAADDALERAISSLEQRHFAKEPDYPHLMAAVAALNADGYKVSKSKVYRDKSLGLIREEPDGTVRSSEVVAYVTRAGLEKKADVATGAVDKMHALKTRKEIERLEAQTAKARFELEKEKGKYILKADAKTEFALKLGTVESVYKNIIRTRSADYIGTVGGDPGKAAMLTALLYADLDEVLNGVCDLDSIDIEILITDENETGP